MYKKIAAILAFILLLTCSLATVSFADAESENKVVYLDENGNEIMTPRWSYVSTTGIALSFNNGRVYMDANINGNNSCAYITARAQLEKKDANGNYSVVITYLDLTTKNTDMPQDFNFNRNRLASVNDSYRFTVAATVYGKDGGSEPITLQTTGTYYP